MNANQLKKLIRLHRYFGMVLGILVLFWALTGVLHPIMSATQPQPVKRMPPSQELDLRSALAVPQLLKQQQIEHFSALQAIQLQSQQVAYRVLKPYQDMAEYYDSQTGQLIQGAEQQDAKRLALWYTGLREQEIVSTTLIAEFSDDYPSVNRLLPIWRVDFSNGLRAYVDTSQSRLSTLSNDQKMWMARIFRLGHTWTWGNQAWTGQTLLMQIALIGILVLIFMGIGLFFKIHNRKNHRLGHKPMRFLHRYLSISLSVFMLLWVISGFYHVWQKKPDIQNIQPVFNTEDLNLEAWQAVVSQPLQRLSLVPIAFNQHQAQAGWLFQPIGQNPMQGSMTAVKEHDHHTHGKSQAPEIKLMDAHTANILNVLQQSRQLAANYLNLPFNQLGQSTWITSFGGEYGFINKRLPVIKIETTLANQLRLYIEPSSGVIAAQVTQQDALEGFSFAYLHKWTWLPIDKTLRDILLAILAGLIAMMVMLGFWIQTQKH
ncbi:MULTISPECIES: PepSY domain-containing protein [unclassified Acinetobacter]|uniref:PepSY domain-containing protein n=1 Tax=unclassified Acinetobacter TaxID=196816 RepID=UPI0024478769|nr:MULTISPECIES: PepSY domain-containing protein [unclassified Acinetobacter]MDH0032729.1 PepSY domain-containing protein [Acinetobacter sp. GD04021]MDH0885986.1 PepSY domain-containing protein [Acinetobacter sp. GD03873]MDH1082606.1 PepSY domain-containing protein [Acinetobacter sp. GD03983]MDH2189599.1 PepSY domain-containing protein [Acinetobacter sp. GD03645]MDH2203570.1 PepSY domain-containing protein [Acinetobacter sp. GD03647]